jgi:tetratricopeptide (TPR) repeat protein
MKPIRVAALLPGLCLFAAATCGTAAFAATGSAPIAEAERLAAQAMERAAKEPEPALADARKALTLTADFEPTAYVRPGRKGEVVEDAYLAARAEYRRHRSRLYEAVGECLARAGRHDAAVRYLQRATDLDPSGTSVVRLARSLVALGRGRPALDVLLARATADLPADLLAVAQQAADVAGVASLQAEIDRVRIGALQVEPKPVYRDGPFVLPEKSRLSSGAPLQLDSEASTVLYVAEASCRTCSADLEAVKRLVPPSSRVVLVPFSAEYDETLRNVAGLYHYPWPFAVGSGIVQALGVTPPSVLVVARHGYVGAVVRAPFPQTLAPTLDTLKRVDLAESLPRSAWNRRPADRKPPPPRPGLLDEGFAPGEDEAAPREFDAAVAAFRGGKPAEALRLFEGLEAKGDGWLLPPEARLDRGICLAALGRREEARLLLLHTGDSRFQEALDRTLERIGSAPAQKR